MLASPNPEVKFRSNSFPVEVKLTHTSAAGASIHVNAEYGFSAVAPIVVPLYVKVFPGPPVAHAGGAGKVPNEVALKQSSPCEKDEIEITKEKKSKKYL